MIRQLTRGLTLSALFAMMAGCAASTESTATEAPEATGATSEALTGNYTWTQGSGPVQMLSTLSGFCFLTEVSGAFRGSGESVSVDVVSGHWQLSGSSGQTAVGTRILARASCVTWPEIGASSGWVAYASPSFETFRSVNVGANGFCYMSGFSGETNGGGEGVNVQYSGSGYTLQASWSSGHGMAGKMACVGLGGGAVFKPAQPLSLRQAWTANCTNNTSCFNRFVYTATQPIYCSLTGLAGKMRGGGEAGSIATVPPNSSVPTRSWEIDADSMQGCADGGCALTVKAACNFY